jgi:hypothetical protein
MQTGLPKEEFGLEDARRLRFVVSYFPFLQGLRFLPLGVLLSAWGLWLCLPFASPRLLRPVELTVVGVGFLAAMGAAVPVGRWYRREFGDVRQRGTTLLLVGVLVALGMAVGYAVFHTPRPAPHPLPPTEAVERLHHFLSLILPWALVGTGALCLRLWNQSGRVATSALVEGVVCAAYGGVLLLGASPFCSLLKAVPFLSDAHCVAVSVLLPLGFLATVGSILDHRLLLRMFGPRVEEE